MAAFAFALATSAALRVASLDLCADEYLLLLARPEQIAAVSRLSHDAAETPLWKAARAHVAHSGRIESLLAVRPTLLLSVGTPGGRSTLSLARKLGMDVLALPFPSSADEVMANLVRVAAALGRPASARPWLDRFARLKANRPPARDAAFVSAGGFSVDAKGLNAGWMALAGFRQRQLAGGRITLEQLALDPPSVLLRSNYRSGQVSLAQRWLDHPLLRKARTHMVITDGRPWTCGGPLMIAEIERLRGLR